LTSYLLFGSYFIKINEQISALHGLLKFGKNGTGKNGTNGKVGKNSTFSILRFG